MFALFTIYKNMKEWLWRKPNTSSAKNKKAFKEKLTPVSEKVRIIFDLLDQKVKSLSPDIWRSSVASTERLNSQY
jgi:hypothetical protein